MTRKIVTVLTLGLLCFQYTFAQQEEEELFGADLIYVGQGKTDNQENISYQKYDIRAVLPVTLNPPETYLLHGFNVGQTKIHYGKQIDTEADINQMYVVSYTLGYSNLMKNNWYFYASAGPYISSNFDSNFDWAEIQATGMILFTKDFRKNLLLNLGLLYHPGFSLEFPVPFVGVIWQPTKKWNLQLGFPELSIDYSLTSSTQIGTNLFLAGDQYTLSKKESIKNSDRKINRLSYADYGMGLQIKQKFLKSFQARISSGHTFYRKLKFQKGTDTVLDMEPKDNFFIQFGVSFFM